jgi:hypothetical protein
VEAKTPIPNLRGELTLGYRRPEAAILILSHLTTTDLTKQNTTCPQHPRTFLIQSFTAIVILSYFVEFFSCLFCAAVLANDLNSYPHASMPQFGLWTASSTFALRTLMCGGGSIAFSSLYSTTTAPAAEADLDLQTLQLFDFLHLAA